MIALPIYFCRAGRPEANSLIIVMKNKKTVILICG